MLPTQKHDSRAKSFSAGLWGDMGESHVTYEPIPLTPMRFASILCVTDNARMQGYVADKKWKNLGKH